MKWASAVVTVPGRAETYLPATLAALRAAGFPDCERFTDDRRRGNVGNWMAALTGLYFDHPRADLFAFFEDDISAVRDIREYIERHPPPYGYWNLYTDFEREDKQRSSGWFEAPKRGRGALGLIFPRDVLVDLLSARWLYLHAQQPDGREGIDGAIHLAMQEKGIKEFCHWPSLLQHVGDVSALHHMRRASKTFPGADVSALEFLEANR